VSSPDVSVVLPVYDEEESIALTLAAILPACPRQPAAPSLHRG